MMNDIENLPIYVISLVRATDRRQKIKKQIDELGLEFEFIDATDERQGLSKEEIDLIGLGNLKQHSNRTSPGAIGALISHLRCYEKIIQSGAEEALILEDDVVLGEGFLPVLKHLLKLPIEYNLLHLGLFFPNENSLPYIGRKTYPLNFWQKRKLDMAADQVSQQFYLGPLGGNSYGSYCYLISRAGCEFSLKNYKSLPYNIDSLMNVTGMPRRLSIVPSIGIQSHDGTYIDYGVSLLIDDQGNMSKSAGIEIDKSTYKHRLWHLVKTQSPDWAISLARTFLVLFLSKSSAYYIRKFKNYFLRKE